MINLEDLYLNNDLSLIDKLRLTKINILNDPYFEISLNQIFSIFALLILFFYLFSIFENLLPNIKNDNDNDKEEDENGNLNEENFDKNLIEELEENKYEQIILLTIILIYSFFGLIKVYLYFIQDDFPDNFINYY